MIHHISIDAHNPLRAAHVLADLWNGEVYQFLYPGSYTVMPFDDYGTAIVVFPLGTAWHPGSDSQPAQLAAAAPDSDNRLALHVVLSVPTTQQQIEQIGQRQGWRVLTRDQGEGTFRLVEFWLENRLLLELLPPGFAADYLQTMQPEAMQRILGQPVL
jgi:hypothetical protein